MLCVCLSCACLCFFILWTAHNEHSAARQTPMQTNAHKTSFCDVQSLWWHIGKICMYCSRVHKNPFAEQVHQRLSRLKCWVNIYERATLTEETETRTRWTDRPDRARANASVCDLFVCIYAQSKHGPACLCCSLSHIVSEIYVHGVNETFSVHCIVTFGARWTIAKATQHFARLFFYSNCISIVSLFSCSESKRTIARYWQLGFLLLLMLQPMLLLRMAIVSEHTRQHFGELTKYQARAPVIPSTIKWTNLPGWSAIINTIIPLERVNTTSTRANHSNHTLLNLLYTYRHSRQKQ